jgi:3-oxoacyl-[acyl-carrier-protein] synthase-3
MSYYTLPIVRISNDYFLELSGLDEEWIFQRTGIRSRSIAGEEENSNALGIEHVNY